MTRVVQALMPRRGVPVPKGIAPKDTVGTVFLVKGITSCLLSQFAECYRYRNGRAFSVRAIG